MLFLTEFVDTRHFNLSKENYHDRKTEAESRVNAMIDYVNNDEECRSVQLLRYFNEKTKHQCGRCDACLINNKRIPYTKIEEKLQSIVNEHPQSMKEVLTQCKEYGEDAILDSIRFLVDSGVLQMDRDGQLKTKKSRHK